MHTSIRKTTTKTIDVSPPSHVAEAGMPGDAMLGGIVDLSNNHHVGMVDECEKQNRNLERTHSIQ